MFSSARAASNSGTSGRTIGGHYPSFAPEAIFEVIPALDSVVRFEGEETLAELVACLDRKASWTNIEGIAWRDGAEIRTNPPRRSAPDLDTLPWPDRSDVDYPSQAVPTASILASRGCPWRCSFCSIITFYEQNGTRGRRRRNPAGVVDEIEHLVRDRGARLLLFQDDDFLAGGPPATRWAHNIADGLRDRGLDREVRFKISCRSDEVREEVLRPLTEVGLVHVYLGVESGDPESLRSLHKNIAAEVHHRAGETLRGLRLGFDFGFMLLEPWSTFASVRTNLAFLRDFCRDGYTTAGFCRTLPYVGTPMERQMRSEGRLEGHALAADYHFLDPRLDALWNFSLAAFEGRNTGPQATWDLLRTLQFESRLSWPGRPASPPFAAAVSILVDASNQLMFDVLDEALTLLEELDLPDAGHPDMVALARVARQGDQDLRRHIAELWRLRPGGTTQELFR